jgi:hypothetical protein
MRISAGRILDLDACLTYTVLDDNSKCNANSDAQDQASSRYSFAPPVSLSSMTGKNFFKLVPISAKEAEALPESDAVLMTEASASDEVIAQLSSRIQSSEAAQLDELIGFVTESYIRYRRLVFDLFVQPDIGSKTTDTLDICDFRRPLLEHRIDVMLLDMAKDKEAAIPGANVHVCQLAKSAPAFQVPAIINSAQPCTNHFVFSGLPDRTQ